MVIDYGNFLFEKSAIKDIQNLPIDIKNIVSDFLIVQLPKETQMSDIKDIKELNGFTSYYSIRKRAYRIGIKIEDSKVTIKRLLHRKEIYKYCP